MGGGGGSSGSIGDIRKLVDKAKKELRAAEKAGRRNVFISFTYEDIAEVNLLRAQAKNEKSPLEFNDWSVSEPFDSERAEYIKRKISDRISQSSATVVFLSSQTKSSTWVKWEVERSIELGKHVIGVYPADSKPSTMPAFIRQHKIKCVAWPKLAETIGNLE